MSRILVTGGTGKLGRLVVERLLALGQTPRVLTRDPASARVLLGSRVELAAGDFDDPASLARAFDGVRRLLLLSPITARLAGHQIAALEVARAAGVGRVVKISGSDWTIDPPGRSVAGAEHARVEDWLAASALPHVSLRPNAWMQVSLPPLIVRLRTGQPLAAAWGQALIGLIDARDIADVAVHQLLEPALAPGPLVLTGPESLSLGAIAARAEALLGRPVPVQPGSLPPPAFGDPFHDRAVAEFMVLIAAGRAAGLTPVVQDLLGRPPRSTRAYLAEALNIAPAPAAEGPR